MKTHELCPNCHNEINTFDKNKVVLNIFNIGKPSYRKHIYYCSNICVESKIRNSNNEGSGEYFPYDIQEKFIVGFHKSKSCEYSVIVDIV